jgi:hypothetical protein
MEVERDHVLRRVGAGDDEDAAALEDFLMAAGQHEEPRDPDAGGEFSALGSEAEFDRVLFDGGEFGTGAAASVVRQSNRRRVAGRLAGPRATPRRPRTSGCHCCGVSSTAWSVPGTT